MIKINESIFEEKKPGFFDKIFGTEQKAPTSNPSDHSNIYNVNEQKWNYISSSEEGYFHDLSAKRKRWIQAATKIKSNDTLTKELLDFSLNGNILNSILYEQTFKDFLGKLEKSKQSTTNIQVFFSMLDEVLRTVLLLEKRKAWAKKEIKDKSLDNPEVLISRVNEIELTKDAYDTLSNKIEKHKDSYVESIGSIIRNLVDRYQQITNKELVDFRKLKGECENEILKRKKPQPDHKELERSISEGLYRFEKELRSEYQVVRTNFFSLYDTDIEKIELNFNQCFESLDRIALSSLRYDRAMTDDKLFSIIIEYEEVEYYMKKLISCMKKISITHVSIISNLRIGSSNFLTEDQSEKNESETLMNNLKDNREILRVVLEVLRRKASNSTMHSSGIINIYMGMYEMISDLTEYLIVIFEVLFLQWTSVNREFKRLSKEKEVNYWRKLYAKYLEIQPESNILGTVLKQKEEFEDLNIFVEEVYMMYISAYQKGILVIDLTDICRKLSSVTPPNESSKDLENLKQSLKTIQKELQAKREEWIRQEKHLIDDSTIEEKYIFVLGDNAKRLDSLCLASTLDSFHRWFDNLCELIESKQIDRHKIVDDRQLKHMDSSKITKFVNSKRIHDIVLSYCNIQ